METRDGFVYDIQAERLADGLVWELTSGDVRLDVDLGYGQCRIRYGDSPYVNFEELPSRLQVSRIMDVLAMARYAALNRRHAHLVSWGEKVARRAHLEKHADELLRAVMAADDCYAQAEEQDRPEGYEAIMAAQKRARRLIRRAAKKFKEE